MSRLAGFLIETATGCTSPTTVGRGWATSPGAGRLITMADGSGLEPHGRGGQVRCGLATTRSGRRPTFRSGAGAPASDSVLAGAAGVVLAGSRSAPVTGSIRGGVDIAAALAGQVAVGAAEVGQAATVAWPPCTTDCATRTLRTCATLTLAERCPRSTPGA